MYPDIDVHPDIEENSDIWVYPDIGVYADTPLGSSEPSSSLAGGSSGMVEQFGARRSGLRFPVSDLKRTRLGTGEFEH
jgi:hypothetical protein